MSNQAQLKVEKGRLKGSLTKLKNFVDNTTTSKSIEELQVRLEKLEQIAREFQIVDDSLTVMGEKSEYESFDDKYLEVKAALRTLINVKQREECKSDADEGSLDTTMTKLVQQQKSFLEELPSSSLNEVRLPKIDLPIFTGDYKDWPAFKDLFTSSIGNRTKLASAAKLQLLKGALKGEAAELIKHLTISDDNYSEAWAKLVKRYDKKRQIVTAYIKTFVNQPSCAHSSTSSVAALRKLADTSDQIIRGIKVLGHMASLRDPWLIYLITTKLDSETRQAWAETTCNKEFPTYDELIQFLNTRCDALETLDTASTSKRNTNSQTLRNCHITTNHSCVICSQSHCIYNCPKYKSLNVQMRRNIVKQHSLCFNCLSSGHSAKNCTSKFKCHFCNQLHHSTLHTGHHKEDNSRQPSTSINPDPSTSTKNITTQSHINSYTALQGNQNKVTILPTALVHIMDNAGNLQPCRLLIDSGSQGSFISESCVSRLQLQRHKAKMVVRGLSSSKAAITRGKVSTTLISRSSSGHQLHVEAYILDSLTAPQPTTTLNVNIWQLIKNYELADPQFNISQKIDMILGADYFIQILQSDQRYVSPELPILQGTIFGYIIAGSINVNDNSSTMISLHTDVCEIENLLKQFWEVESLPDITKNSTMEQFTDENNYCESFFSQTHYIDPVTQRYVVRLPFKEGSPSLGNSINQAMSCFKSLERRFQNNQYLLQEYTNFMEEYEKLGHMEPVPSDILSTSSEHMYLPHHAVIKPTSTTTKVRVVFNGSAKTDNGTSLNQKMLIGPKTQRDLLPILLSFRTYEVAVVPDIEKMYRQILVDPHDRNYQRILWRKQPNQPIQHMWLTTVTYGTSAAPYLATRALNQLPIEFKDEFPLAEQSIRNNFYVDDFLGGAENEEQAFELCNQLSTLLNRRGFKLRKWASNSQQLMHLLQSHHGTVSCAKIDSRLEGLKVLGMQWLPSNDIFSYEVMTSQFERLTKRLILSESSKLFDPLGLVSPVTITFKILIQQLWLKNYDWDERCIDLEEKWNTLYKQLHHLQNIQIPRFINIRAESSDIEIHGFADASEAAYAAVIYCRVSNTSATPNVVIIMAKTKVCPIKQFSIPRLELCAAVLLTKLMKFVQQNLNISGDHCFAWSDSAIVLAWLSSNPRKWNTFVSNRTSFILDTLPRSQWNHVPSTQNPADLASRGLSAKKLQQSSLWWTGPDWLVNNWRERLKPLNYTSHTIPEQRKRYIENFHTQVKEHLLTHLFKKFSEFSYIIRILRRCFHFTRNCSKQKSQKTSWATAEDQKKAMHACILWAQSEAFHDEINNLKTTHSIKTSSHISTLTPFLDDTGLLRVGGRLAHSLESYNSKHPIILPKDHIFVHSFLIYLHKKYLHANLSILMNIVRQQFWILSCRTVIKSIINKCVTCVRNRSKISQQLMANLPQHRVGNYRAFENIGIDYAGPLYLLNRRGRGASSIKGYLVVFVCFSTRAIHLELAGDMTSEGFIASLKRFTSRRGLPSNIYTDNGTNFVGAHRYLNEVDEIISKSNNNSALHDFLSTNNINWHFNPPAAPHFGGLWEAGVKAVKTILRRVIGDTKFIYEEMNTLLIQIEGLLNSRPLVPMNDDPKDLNALTPAHFLIGQPLVTIPEVPQINHISLHNRWRLLQQTHQHFWKRWSHEYLSTLQRRPKWQRVEQNLKTGDMVVVKEPNLMAAKWMLGRIENVHPGKDNIVRVATVRTMHGTFKRPVVKLCKLPIE